MAKVEFLVVPQQQQQQQQQSEAAARKSPSNHVAPKHSEQMCLQHFSSTLKTQPCRKGASNYYNEIWGKEDRMDDGRWVFN